MPPIVIPIYFLLHNCVIRTKSSNTEIFAIFSFLSETVLQFHIHHVIVLVLAEPTFVSQENIGTSQHFNAISKVVGYFGHEGEAGKLLGLAVEVAGSVVVPEIPSYQLVTNSLVIGNTPIKNSLKRTSKPPTN